MSVTEEGFIYFVQSVDGGPIKVGFAREVYVRLAQLQTSHSARLRILAVRRGSVLDERALHDRLAPSRLSGEWFEQSDELAALIAESDPPPEPDAPKESCGRPKGPTEAEMARELAAALRREFGEGPQAVKRVAKLCRVTPRAVDNWFKGTHCMSAYCLVRLCEVSDDVFWTTMRLAGREEQLRALMSVSHEDIQAVYDRIDEIAQMFVNEIDVFRSRIPAPPRPAGIATGQ